MSIFNPAPVPRGRPGAGIFERRLKMTNQATYQLWLLNEWHGNPELSPYGIAPIFKPRLVAEHINQEVANKHLARCKRDFPKGKYELRIV